MPGVELPVPTAFTLKMGTQVNSHGVSLLVLSHCDLSNAFVLQDMGPDLILQYCHVSGFCCDISSSCSALPHLTLV